MGLMTKSRESGRDASPTAEPPRFAPFALVWSLLIVDPLIILSTIVCSTVSVVFTFIDAKGRIPMAMARVWARSLLFFAGARVTVEGLDKIDPNGSYVFASNHASYMDTPTVLSNIPVQFRFLAKRGLFQIPFLGTHLARAGHIPVPRDDPRAAVRTLTRAAEVIHEHHTSILIFPEGGRTHDGEMHEFKEGAAYIAIKAAVPIVPVALIGTRAILPFNSGTFHPGRIRLRIGDPIPTAGLTLRDRGALTVSVREQVARMLQDI
ncbi:MAG TPA: lysophospholipid acyltransferase family protein [Bryobacteraceae bacterium]|nr:lysophospholipid acyltransferase family protein [Bryobacteraceae bacterium]